MSATNNTKSTHERLLQTLQKAKELTDQLRDEHAAEGCSCSLCGLEPGQIGDLIGLAYSLEVGESMLFCQQPPRPLSKRQLQALRRRFVAQSNGN